MPINMQELYTQDPGAAQVEEGTGQAEYTPPVQTQDATAGQATASQADAAQTGPAAQAGQTSVAPAATADAALAGGAMTNMVEQAQAATSTYEARKASDEATDIMAQDSPLMQRAEQQGILSAARRGLQNSSIAAGAAQGAMADRAVPLALANADAINQASAYNAEAENRMSLAGIDANSRAILQDAGLVTQTGQFNAGQINDMASLEAQIGAQTEQFNAAQRNAIMQLNAQMQQDSNQFNASEQNRISALNAQMETEISSRNAAAANEGAFLDAQLRTSISDANAARQLAVAQGNMQEANRQQQFIMDMNNDLNKQYLAGAQAMDLANIQGRYNQLISANENAARLFEAHFNSISATMANDKISPERVAGYVNVSQNMLESGLAMMDQMNSIDLGEFQLPTAGSSGTGRTQVPTTSGGSGIGYGDEGSVPEPETPSYPGVPNYGTPEWDSYLDGLDLNNIFIGGVGSA